MADISSPEPAELIAETPLSRNLSTNNWLSNGFRALLSSFLTTLVLAVAVVHAAVFASNGPGVYGGPRQIEIAFYWAVAVYALRSLFAAHFGGIDSINVLVTKWLGWDKAKNSGIKVFSWKLGIPVIATLIGIFAGWFAGAGIGWAIFNGASGFSLAPEALNIPATFVNGGLGTLFLVQLVPKLFIALTEAFLGHKDNGNLLVAAVTGAMVGVFSPLIGASVGFVHVLAFEVVLTGTTKGPTWIHLASEGVSIILAVVVYWFVFKMDAIKSGARKLADKAKALRNK